MLCCRRNRGRTEKHMILFNKILYLQIILRASFIWLHSKSKKSDKIHLRKSNTYIFSIFMWPHIYSTVWNNVIIWWRICTDNMVFWEEVRTCFNKMLVETYPFSVIPIGWFLVTGIVNFLRRVDCGGKIFQQRSRIDFLIIQQHREGVIRLQDQSVQMGALVLKRLLHSITENRNT